MLLWTEMYDWYAAQVCNAKNGESVSEDGKITLGVLYEDTHKEELCDVQAEKQEAAKK